MAEQGRTFAGAAAVLAQKPSDRARSWEPFRQLNPRIAARDVAARVAAIERLRSFRERYQAALAKFKQKVDGVVFPLGTYWLRVQLSVPCESS
ncbi:MAG: hypothetical protein QM767_22875 [Anaeromyxobacter sp.]